jgi:hypothetical protein
MNKPALPKGHASILSPTFKYVPAASTDLAKTFARIRAQRVATVRAVNNVAVFQPRHPAHTANVGQ